MANIFGTATELPRPVREEDLTAPSFDRGEYIDYEPVREDGGFNLDDMLSSNIDESLRRMEAEVDPEAGGDPDAPVSDTIPDEETLDSDTLFDIDDLDATMIAEMWNDLRVSAHSELYKWAVYKHPKRAKAMARELGMKDHKTEAEKALLQELWTYVDKHDELRTEYISAVPYSEKHQALMVRFVEYQINRMRMQGKSFPRWLMWVYLFLVPEVQMGIKFAKIRSEMPQFNFDFEQFQRQQHGAQG